VNTKLLAAGVAVIVAVAAAVLLLAGRGGEATPAAAAKVPELTGSLEKDAVALAKYLAGQGIHRVRFTVWGAGDPNSVLRTLAVVEAAHRLNRLFRESGVNFTIAVEQNFKRGGGDELADTFAKSFQSGQNPDIMANSYKHIARFAEEGYLLDITPYVEKYMDTELADYYRNLLDAVRYKGRYWGLPQDTEARPLYWDRKVAACVREKTGEDILADLYARVERGEVTWHDVYRYAKAAVGNGCSEWGVLHRKGSAHPDLIQFIYAFGGRLEDRETGKLVLDVPAVYKWLYVEWRMARDKLIPSDMMSWDWAKQIHPAVVCDKTLIWIGGTWHWTEWQTKPYCNGRPLTAEEVKEKFYFTLFPAGDPGDKPVTLSQPFVWLIASNAGKDNPRYEELKEAYHRLAFILVAKANDPDLVAIHSIISAHLPIREKAAELIADKQWVEKLAKMQVDLSPDAANAIKDIVEKTVNPVNVEFLAEASKLLKYTHLTPVHPLYPRLADILRDAVDKVLRGEMDPRQAIDYIKQKIEADPELAKNVEIVGEVPADWKYP